MVSVGSTSGETRLVERLVIAGLRLVFILVALVVIFAAAGYVPCDGVDISCRS